MDDEQMTIKEAIRHVLDNYDIPSRYALARALSNETLNVQPIQINNYLKGTRVSKKVAERFLDLYNIVIIDVHDPSYWKLLEDDI